MTFFDAESEYRLLASIVDYPDTIKSITDELFTEERRKLYIAMHECFFKYGGEISQEGVERFYGKPIPPQIEAARGAKPGPIIDKLKILATKRQIRAMQDQLESLLKAPEPSIADIQNATHFRPVLTSQDTTLRYGISQFVYDLQAKMSGEYKFIRTGIDFLDIMLGGEWPRQGLTVVLGRAGGGKTALVCNSMLNMAMLNDPIPSLFMSLEMRNKQLVNRLVANKKRIDGIKLKNGTIKREELDIVNQGIIEIQSLPIYIDDRPNITVNDIVHAMRYHKEAYNTQVVFVDYLQIINRQSGNDEILSESLGAIAQDLRNAAVSEDMSVVLLAQQNRTHTGLDSILGSGRVGQIADVVFEIRIGEERSDEVKMCDFEFHKNREGPIGTQSAIYLPKYLAFQ